MRTARSVNNGMEYRIGSNSLSHVGHPARSAAPVARSSFPAGRTGDFIFQNSLYHQNNLYQLSG